MIVVQTSSEKKGLGVFVALALAIFSARNGAGATSPDARPLPSTAAIACDAVGPDAVFGVALPSKYSSEHSLADAEDVVQETYARWYAMSPERRDAVASPGGWVTTVASRICLDLLGSARARRERYVGEWIPEPLPGRPDWVTGTSGDATRTTGPSRSSRRARTLSHLAEDVTQAAFVDAGSIS